MEIHHSVKNNVETIWSLLRLQLGKLTDPNAGMVLKESQNRILSMAMVHQLLYQSQDMNHINFKTYLETLASHIFQSSDRDPQALSLVVEADEGYIDLVTAVPCGMIATELISNALKHAFPQNREGTLSVIFKLKDKNRVSLKVQDDGIGFPPNMDWRKSPSLGFSIVSSLCRQIDAVLDVKQAGETGTSFTLTFPLTAQPIASSF